MIRLVAATAVALLLAGLSLFAVPPARACACGAPAMPDGVNATATQEIALLRWDGRTEIMEMRLALQSTGDRGALVVPTPAPATVSAGAASAFQELGWLTRPRTETRRRPFGFPNIIPLMGAAAPGAPDVLARVRIGPLEAVTLRGGDAAGLRKWLADNGFALRAPVADTLGGYVRDGWSFVALRLVGEDLQGGLAPVRLAFPSSRLVYPMRMSRAARETQRVTVYVLAPHRMDRSDGDRGRQQVALDFAGRIRADDAHLNELTASGHDYLTRLTTVAEPAAITTDFVFDRAPTDAPYRRTEVEYRTDGISALITLAVVGGAAVAFALVARAAIRHDRRTRHDADGADRS